MIILCCFVLKQTFGELYIINHCGFKFLFDKKERKTHLFDLILILWTKFAERQTKTDCFKVQNKYSRWLLGNESSSLSHSATSEEVTGTQCLKKLTSVEVFFKFLLIFVSLNGNHHEFLKLKLMIWINVVLTLGYKQNSIENPKYPYGLDTVSVLIMGGFGVRYPPCRRWIIVLFVASKPGGSAYLPSFP